MNGDDYINIARLIVISDFTEDILQDYCNEFMEV